VYEADKTYPESEVGLGLMVSPASKATLLSGPDPWEQRCYGPRSEPSIKLMSESYWFYCSILSRVISCNATKTLPKFSLGIHSLISW